MIFKRSTSTVSDSDITNSDGHMRGNATKSDNLTFLWVKFNVSLKCKIVTYIYEFLKPMTTTTKKSNVVCIQNTVNKQ